MVIRTVVDEPPEPPAFFTARQLKSMLGIPAGNEHNGVLALDERSDGQIKIILLPVDSAPIARVEITFAVVDRGLGDESAGIEISDHMSVMRSDSREAGLAFFARIKENITAAVGTEAAEMLCEQRFGFAGFEDVPESTEE